MNHVELNYALKQCQIKDNALISLAHLTLDERKGHVCVVLNAADPQKHL